MTKKRKKKKEKPWEVPAIASNDHEIIKQLNMVISYANASKSCNHQKRYSLAYEFSARISEIIHVIMKGMEELPPQ